ncbi:concanavalin A-like lectin/glucanase domain-containing protein [Rhizophagus irregularis DAOM 181602=DAOM 197198]|nr:concanavalin A-like lectin/glucanase domain-containing protein [Rhizophagus irregularis DAOM 181602=DAOM 197198]
MGSVRAKVILENNGIYEWDVIIEKECIRYSVGVCDSEKFNYGVFAGDQPNACVLDSYVVSLYYPGRFRIQSHQKRI